MNNNKKPKLDTGIVQEEGSVDIDGLLVSLMQRTKIFHIRGID
jgi:hypothetical protein